MRGQDRTSRAQLLAVVRFHLSGCSGSVIGQTLSAVTFYSFCFESNFLHVLLQTTWSPDPVCLRRALTDGAAGGFHGSDRGHSAHSTDGRGGQPSVQVRERKTSRVAAFSVLLFPTQTLLTNAASESQQRFTEGVHHTFLPPPAPGGGGGRAVSCCRWRRKKERRKRRRRKKERRTRRRRKQDGGRGV